MYLYYEFCWWHNDLLIILRPETYCKQWTVSIHWLLDSALHLEFMASNSKHWLNPHCNGYWNELYISTKTAEVGTMCGETAMPAQDSWFGCELQLIFGLKHLRYLILAEDGFDPSTSGLWAQHASAAPLCLKPPQTGLEPTIPGLGGQCLIH